MRLKLRIIDQFKQYRRLPGTLMFLVVINNKWKSPRYINRLTILGFTSSPGN